MRNVYEGQDKRYEKLDRNFAEYRQDYDAGFSSSRMFEPMDSTKSKAWQDGWREGLRTDPMNRVNLSSPLGW